VALPVHATTFTDTFTSYYAFGDSLSDNGKIPLPLPYSTNPETGGGRFSNGPVWTEFLAQRFSDRGLNTANLALGGATAGEENIRTNGIDTAGDPEFPAILQPFATFSRQIAAFVPLALSPLPQDNPLVSVFLGGNDFLQGESASAAAEAVASGIAAINALAGNFDDFLVSDLPELGDPPAGGGQTFAMTFNQVLDERLDELALGGINIIKLSQAEFQADLFPRLTSLGINPLAGPCLDEAAMTDCTITGVNPDGSFIRDLSLANERYLIDSVHPSAPVHAEFGAFAINLVEARLPAPVPLPAGLPLLIGGLGALGMLRMRAQKLTAQTV
jgi:phospholipase/lecithinase/hemolysin